MWFMVRCTFSVKSTPSILCYLQNRKKTNSVRDSPWKSIYIVRSSNFNLATIMHRNVLLHKNRIKTKKERGEIECHCISIMDNKHAMVQGPYDLYIQYYVFINLHCSSDPCHNSIIVYRNQIIKYEVINVPVPNTN